MKGSVLFSVVLFLRKLTAIIKKKNNKKQKTKPHKNNLQLRLIIFPGFVEWLLEILRKEKMKLKLNVLLLKGE